MKRSLYLYLLLIISYSCSFLFAQTKLTNHVGDVVTFSRPEKYSPGELLVKFRASSSPSARLLAHAAVGGRTSRRFTSVPGLELAEVPTSASIAALIAAYRRNPAVEYAEPNYRVHSLDAPNDPQFGQLWALHNTGQDGGKPGSDIKAVQAWALSTGDPNVVIATLDTGIDYTHPDLLANMFRNAKDCNSNGIDDDGNGYVDDCYGIAPANLNSDPLDDNGHGTHTSGTIGAIGNNGVGVAGVNWSVKLMPCKFLDANGGGTDADAITCLDYVKVMKDRGVNIVATNNSWGGTDYSQALYDAIQQQMQDGILFIAAAGNDFSNNDAIPVYPASFDLPNIIAVAATNHSDELASFSNIGAHSVAIAAPGDHILSTLLGGQYGFLSGTSMATPHVTGVAALLAAQYPSRKWYEIKNLILTGGDSVSDLTRDTFSGKRLDAYGAMTCNSQSLMARTRPVSNTISGAVGSPIILRELNINCGEPAGPVQVTVTETGETISLTDAATGADQVAGDGVYSAQWTPSTRGEYTLNFPNGDTVIATVLAPYTSQQTTTSYVPITGTSLDLDDDSVGALSSPFAVNFGGGKFNQLFVSSNGTVSFTNQFGNFSNDLIPVQDTRVTTLVAPFWDDLFPVKGSAQNVFWQVVGSSPNRQLVIEWRDVREFACKYDSTATIKFEVVFDEADSNVQFNYADTKFDGDCVQYNNGSSATVGIETSPGQGRMWSSFSQSVQAGTSILWQTNVTPATNPVPVLTSLSPSQVPIGSPDTTITLNGSNFVPDTIGRWNLINRPTTYISSTQVQVLLSAGDMSSIFAPQVTIDTFNPAPGGGSSNSLYLGLVNGTPAIASIFPPSINAGDPAFSLVVVGNNFTASSVVTWNGKALATVLSSSSQLTATVPSNFSSASGTASLLVNNGTGGVSNPVTLTVRPPASTGFRPPYYVSGRAPAAAPSAKPQRFLGWNYARTAGPEYLKQFQRASARAAGKSETSEHSDAALASSSSLPDIALRKLLPAGFIPTGIASGDFDHDGRMDWAVCNGGENTIWIYLGNGDGTWQLPTIIPLFGAAPVWVAAADLRHSGVMDLVVAEADSGSIGVVLGNGDGTFQPEQEIYIPGSPLFIAIADMNNDGKLDVVAALNGSDYALSVLPGNGDGTFGPAINAPRPVSFDQPSTVWIAVADFDGDGIPDVVAVDQAYYGGIFLYLNRGDGMLKFEGQVADNPYFPYETVSAADLNHDGCADIVATDDSLNATVYLGTCRGLPASTGKKYGIGEFSIGSLLADVNGDGNVDLVAAGFEIDSGYGQSSGGLLSVMLGDGKGGFANPRLYRGGVSTVGITTADINGDGKIDILTANERTDSATLFVNDGKGAFGPPDGEYVGVVTGTAGGTINSPLSDPVAVDIDGDGKQDIALFQVGPSNSTAYNISSMLNDGTGHFGSPINSPLMPSSDYVWSYAFADFRKVGHPDLIVSVTDMDSTNLGFLYSKGDGKGRFSTPVSIPALGTGASTFAVGDLNGDGFLDFVAANGVYGATNSNQLTVYLGHGDGTFTASAPISYGGTTSTWAQQVFVGDFNHDGKLDVLTHMYYNEVPYKDHDVYEFLGNGDGTFQSGKIVIHNTDQIAVADLNHDGFPDVVEYEDPERYYPDPMQPSRIRVYLGQPDGSFPLAHSYQPYSGYAVVPPLTNVGSHRPSWFGDFNGDGNMDVAVFQRPGYLPYAYAQIMVGNGDGTFTPTYGANQLDTNAVPQLAMDANGDGKDDFVELDGFSSSFHVLLSDSAHALQAATVAEPIVGKSGTLRITFDVPPSPGTTVLLAASDQAITIPASIAASGTPTQDVPFTIGSAVNPLHVFSIQARMGSDVATAYATQAAGNSQASYKLSTYLSTMETLAGQPTADFKPSLLSIDGYSSTVALSCSGLPAGAACVFGTNQVFLPAGDFNQTSLVINSALSVVPGTYTFLLTATDGTLTSTLPLQYIVDEPAADFSITVANPNVTIFRGETASYSFTVSTTVTFNGTINYSCSGLPVGISCSFSSGQMKVDSTNLVAGSYSFNLVGTLGSVVHSSALTLAVQDVTAVASPTSSTMKVGGSTNVALTLTPLGGFSYALSLSCPGLPSSVQCTFDNPQVQFDGITSKTVNLTIKATAVPAASTAPRGSLSLLLAGGVMLGMVYMPFRRRLRLVLVGSLIVSAIFWIACSGGGSAVPTPPPTRATILVTVSGSNGAFTKHLSTINLTVSN